MFQGIRSSGVVIRSEKLVALDVVVVILNRPKQFGVKNLRVVTGLQYLVVSYGVSLYAGVISDHRF